MLCSFQSTKVHRQRLLLKSHPVAQSTNFEGKEPSKLNSRLILPRKEVIQPHLPIRLPCYDFTPVIEPAFDCSLLTVGSQASGIPNSHGVTGGVYKTRERIHRDILIRDY